MLQSIPVGSDLKDIFTYEVDDYDSICRTGSNQNTGHKIEDNAYQYSSMNFDAMFSDEKTLSVFKSLLNHVRESQAVVSFPYRCDTETMCFYYRLTISISTARHVLFFNKLLGVDSRQNGAIWKHSKDDGPDAIELCSICNKFLVDEHWIEFQEMVDSNIWPARGREMPCDYTVCNTCERGINQRISESDKFIDR